MVSVSWFDAVEYCEWLAAQWNLPVRLPTEAEWEFAARGGFPQRLYPWGDALPAMQPDRWRDGPEPVGLGEPNGYGLFDMCQNVHEWCSDWYDPAYYAVSPEVDPQGPAHGVRRASKGGAWRHHIKFSRCAARSSIPPDFRYADYGFRVVVAGLSYVAAFGRFPPVKSEQSSDLCDMVGQGFPLPSDPAPSVDWARPNRAYGSSTPSLQIYDT